MAKMNFQKQAAGMKKLREMLVKAGKYSGNEIEEYILLGGQASISGVENNIGTSIAQLDRMIKDCEGRIKWEQDEKDEKPKPRKKKVEWQHD